MIPTTAHIDAYHAATHHLLNRLRTALLDLIDCGTTTPNPQPRKPTPQEQTATDLPSGNYEPTPTSPHRRSGRSDPTGRAVEAWETDIQHAVTRLYAIVTATEHIVTPLAHLARPTDEHGQPLDPPREPRLRTVKHGRNAGSQIADEPPTLARLAILDATRWIAATIDATADAMRNVNDGDVGDHILVQADRITSLLRSELARHAPTVTGPATIRCQVCSKPAKYRRLKRCDTCRRRELRTTPA